MRKCVMQGAVFLIVAFLAAVCPLCVAEAKIPIEDYVKGPALRAPIISPSGKYLARAQIIDEKKYAVGVFDLDNPSAKPTGTMMPEGVVIDAIHWANDNRIVVSGYELYSNKAGTQFGVGTTRIIAFDRDGKNLKVLFNNKRLQEYTWGEADWVHPLPKEPDHVLLGTNDEYGRYHLYRVNVVDGTAEIVEKGDKSTYGWLTDVQGVARVRLDGDFTTGRRQVLMRRGTSSQWDLVTEYNEREVPDFSLLGFTDDPQIALVAARNGGDRYSVFEYNIVSRSFGRQVFQSSSVDVGWPDGDAVYDPHTTKLLGISFVDDIWVRHYFDPEIARVQASFEQGFAGEAVVSPTSWSEDRKRFVFYTEGPNNPGSYFYFNAEMNQASLIGKQKPWLAESEFGDVLIIKYPVRDGSKVPGYLTLPPGKGDKNLPMVVMPHGGPERRDFVQFDEWAQFLANRGYAVFQPNFRGSGGYGKAFAEKGHRQWGRLMQDDISDGVKALIKDGTADAGRICIFGASYGGYAALAGGAFTPELYKCVASFAGVSDLPQMMADEKSAHGSSARVYKYWASWVGEPATDLDAMKTVSPVFHASKFVAPVLLMHGTADRIVLPNQSNRMEKALSAAGKKVEYIQFPDQGHGVFGKSTKTRFYTELEKFFGAHIGN